MNQPDLVVFSHLRWGFVHQRPQHLLSRLAEHWRITFIEEPVHTDGPAWMEVLKRDDPVTVVVPHTPMRNPGFDGARLSQLRPLVARWLAQEHIERPVTWLYTPMALPLAMALEPLCLVYDCMDDLGGFQGAPGNLRQLESALLLKASLVLTGGPSLYASRRRMNPNVHCVPSSVDAGHFARARLDHGSAAAQAVSALQGAASGPRLGWFGVIDERMNIELVAQMADEHPEWQITMVGPVVKIDPGTLPRRANIQWLGMQAYEWLPYFLAGWDVCLMPFALNEATRFISPTKTLEYMAGDKPVVSTAVNDVLGMYTPAVEVAYTPKGFIRACERLLGASDAARAERSREMATLVAQHSWDRSARKVHVLLNRLREEALDSPAVRHRAVAPQPGVPGDGGAARA